MRITEDGYILETANEWYNKIVDMYLEIDPNWDLTPSSPDGLFVATTSEVFATLDELMQQAYNSKDPAKAQGLDLDVLAYLTTGLPRKLGTASSVTMELIGTDGTVIPKDTQFQSTTDRTKWLLSEDVILNGATQATALCEDLGAIPASVDTITKIVEPLASLDTATNTTIATIGTNPESDPQLRARRQKSVAQTGSNQVSNMYSVIESLPDVAETKIYENYTNLTDSDGVEPHSLAIIVNGGEDQEVADAIYSKKNPGCGLCFVGSDTSKHITKLVVSPVTQNEMNILFNRPVPVDIFIEIQITNDGSLPEDANTLISDSIIAYAAGLTEYVTGFRTIGFNIGDNVIYSSLFTPINQILGSFGSSYVTELLIGRVSNALSTSNIIITPFELSQFTTPNMTITIT